MKECSRVDQCQMSVKRILHRSQGLSIILGMAAGDELFTPDTRRVGRRASICLMPSVVKGSSFLYSELLSSTCVYPCKVIALESSRLVLRRQCLIRMCQELTCPTIRPDKNHVTSTPILQPSTLGEFAAA